MSKIPETDAIFENVFAANQAADEDSRCLRLSIDSQAKVKIGNLLRGGKARRLEALGADDQDSEWLPVFLKRQTYGRDGIELLRRRFLLASEAV